MGRGSARLRGGVRREERAVGLRLEGRLALRDRRAVASHQMREPLPHVGREGAWKQREARDESARAYQGETACRFYERARRERTRTLFRAPPVARVVEVHLARAVEQRLLDEEGPAERAYARSKQPAHRRHRRRGARRMFASPPENICCFHTRWLEVMISRELLTRASVCSNCRTVSKASSSFGSGVCVG